MTTTVKIDAHCSPDKEVSVAISDDGAVGTTGDKFVLQDGEHAERVVYDNRVITVREVVKEKAS